MASRSAGVRQLSMAELTASSSVPRPRPRKPPFIASSRRTARAWLASPLCSACASARSFPDISSDSMAFRLWPVRAS